MSTVNSATSSEVINNLQKTSSSGSPKAMEMGTQSSFLRLLTEQLKNQDPLSPMDNAQMTSQLAQISTVDGLGKLNTTLSTLLESSQSGEAMQAAALVGKGVMVAMMALFGQSLVSAMKNPFYLVLAIAIWAGMYFASKHFCKKHEID